MATRRKPWVGGNWKCNGSLEIIQTLADQLNVANFNPKQIDVVVCSPAIYIQHAKSKLKEDFQVAIQNISQFSEGAFTGEISAGMVADFGLTWTLIGHSERRQLFGESDDSVANRVAKAQAVGICATVCVGELLEERERGETANVCRRQIIAFITSVSDWSKIVIAYEPVWAIGTGKVATPEQAQVVHKEIRELLEEKVGKDVAHAVRIVYGGSVTENNCAALISQEDIDGFLVGGASLKPGFVSIIENVSARYR